MQLRVNPADVTLRAFQYAAGDVNMDQQVDPDDINLILRARKYDAGPSNATWAQGDVDNDQDVDPDDINLILRGRRYDRGTYGEVAISMSDATAAGVTSAKSSLADAFAGVAQPKVKADAAGNSKAFREPGSFQSPGGKVLTTCEHVATEGESSRSGGAERRPLRPRRNQPDNPTLAALILEVQRTFMNRVPFGELTKPA